VGLLDSVRTLRTTATVEPAQREVNAAFENLFNNEAWYPDMSAVRISRKRALTVPAVQRARNIICGTAGSLPIERYAKNGNRHLPAIPLQYQPDPAYPASVTWTYIFESMLFYGGSFVEVISVYAEDGRVANFRWIDPARVNPQYDMTGTMITGYLLDGKPTPANGVGSLKYFPSFSDGMLAHAGRTIETAIELEEAANRAAKEPMPQVVLKDKGSGLTAEKITAMLSGWKNARRERATAYISPNFDVETLGFDARSQQLVEARMFHASEIARACNVPAWYLNAESASATYSNVESERRALIDFSIRPLLKAVEDRLGMADFSSRDIEFRFDLDDFLRGNATERVAVTTQLLAAGIIDVEEAREMEDLAPRGDTSVN
jgi:HK97 family phage portal protein